MLEAFTNGVCKSINPEYELLRLKAMCGGDPTCVQFIRKKITVERVKM